MKEYLAAILPCNDLDETQIFFGRLGFSLQDGSLDEYRVLSDGLGGLIPPSLRADSRFRFPDAMGL
jgi:hypothetical protein